jgi:hypothetical protein
VTDPLPARVTCFRALLRTGFAGDGSGLLNGWSGLLHPLDDPGCPGWVPGRLALGILSCLSDEGEKVCALLALEPGVRESWAGLAAARCREAGHMDGGGLLLRYISDLGKAASWVERAMPTAAIAPGPYTALERDVLGMSLDQSTATSVLMRVLGAAARLAVCNDSLPALFPVEDTGRDALTNWMPGRLLGLPGSPAHDRALLHGLFTDDGAADCSSMDTMLKTPWVFLLAMVVYAQDVWQAEGRGGLVLELPQGGSAFQPHRIAVAVQGPDGDEGIVGTLADLVTAVLDHLGMAFFPGQPTPSELDAALSPLAGRMLSHRIWHYQDGAGGEKGRYRIHPEFSDACYRLPGSRVFNRTGRHVWQAVRLCAEALYRDKRRV